MDIIKSIVGEQLSAVSFVMDYVELHFNGSIVRCVADPVVEDAETQLRFPGPGSRDALCRVIGATLGSVKADAGKALKLGFSAGISITIPLDSESRHGGEAVHFVPGIDQPISVW